MFWLVSKWRIHILLHARWSSDKLSNILCSVTMCHDLVSVVARSHGVCCTKKTMQLDAVKSHTFTKKIPHPLPQTTKSMHHYLVTVNLVRCYCTNPPLEISCALNTHSRPARNTLHSPRWCCRSSPFSWWWHFCQSGQTHQLPEE